MTEPSINPITKEDELREALRKVVDPEIGLSVIELGLIRGIEIETDKANLTIIMTTPFCPYAPMLIDQIRTTAQDTLQVPTTIELGDELWEPSMMEEGAGGDWGLF